MQILLMVGGFNVDGGAELSLIVVNIDIPNSLPLTSLSVLCNVSDSKFPTTLPRQLNLSKPEKSALRSLRTNPTSLFSLPIRQHYCRPRQEWLPCGGGPSPFRSIHLPTPLNPTTKTSTVSSSLLVSPKAYPKPGNLGRPIVSSYAYRVSASNISSSMSRIPIIFLTRSDLSLPPLHPPDIIMATVDVSSLYTNIPQCHGLSALEYFLNQRPSHTLASTQFLVQLTRMASPMLT